MKSSVDTPGAAGAYETVTSCQDVLSVSNVVCVPTKVLPLYSRNLSLSVAPATSARAHRAPVYVPADVVNAQLGESFSTHVAAVVPALVSCAAQLPEWPPATRLSVMLVLPDPEVFHPDVLVSKPGLPTRLGGGGTVVVVLVEVVVDGGGWVDVVLVEVVVDDVVLLVLVSVVLVVGGSVDVVVVSVVLVLVDVEVVVLVEVVLLVLVAEVVVVDGGSVDVVLV